LTIAFNKITMETSTKMQFENVTQVNDRKMTFRLSPVDVAYANTLRRLIMIGVETVGFRADMTSAGTTTDVMVTKNDTPMTNETLAHRIGLLPIHVPNPLEWKADNYIFQLSVSNDSNSILDVNASDFKVFEKKNPDSEPIEIETARFFKPHPITRDTCLIATLQPASGNVKQSIELTAKATIGTGRENARFIPTSQCTYEYTRSDDPERMKQLFTHWLLQSKKVSIDSLEEGSDSYKKFWREFNTMESARCHLTDDNDEPYSFDFTVESVGTLDVKYIVKRACEVGESMCAQFVNITSSSETPANLTITPSNSRIIGFDFLFRGHDHTLGNLLQTWLVKNHISGNSSPKVKFAGYVIPHPLRDEMVLTVGVADGEESTARQAVAEACKGCVAMFQTMKLTWMSANGFAVAPTPVQQSAVKIPTFRRKTPSAKQ
jgi:DNA-directed RNA polymerase subunit L/DNA-directed RNA polymerase alpha subunit